MRVKYEEVTEGAVPSEKVVILRTANGNSEEIVVHRSFVDDRSLEVSRIAEEDNSVLVELPQESTSGNWRIWVSATTVA